jgi:hypothetical protein
VRHGLGCNPCPDQAIGTHSLEEVLGASAVSPPATLDLSMLVKVIRAQGKSGCCVGFGTTQAMANCARQSGYPDFEDPSALAGYVQARAVAGELKDPVDGTTISAAMEGYQRGGFLYEKDYPYLEAKKFDGLPLGLGQAGLLRADVKVHRIIEVPGPSLKDAVKTLLASGKGVVGGWRVDAPFEDWTADQEPWNGLAEASVGGHCMCVQDYPKGLPRLTNSWGPDEGDHGFWTITWEALFQATALWAIDFVPCI